MKSWLAKFRISAAHDTGKPLPASLRQTLRTSEELRQFQERTRAVEQALAETKPALEAPPFLHRAIMRSVEAAAEPAGMPAKLHWLRWLATPALAVGLALGLWYALKPAAPQPDLAPLAAIGTTLELGSSAPQTLPPALLAPLSEELQRLNQDLDNTARFLLASLP